MGQIVMLFDKPCPRLRTVNSLSGIIRKQLKEHEMSKNQCGANRYYGAVFYDSLVLPVDDAFKRFLEGNIEPLVTKINQEQFNHLYLSPQRDLSLPLNNKQLDYLAHLISQVPSVEHLELTANLTSEQAAQFAHSLANSNICDFDLQRSTSVSSQGIQQYINTLSDTKVTDFSLSYTQLDDTAIDAMQFKDTTFTGLDLYDIQISEYGFTKLIQSTYSSNIDDLFIDSDIDLSPNAFKDIDFSKTNINTMELSSLHFEGDALAHLKLKNSQVEKFYLYDNFLSSNDLGHLSTSLQGSPVKLLKIVQSLDEVLDLSKLTLQDTHIETLNLHGRFDTDGLCNLNLTNTPVKTLDFSYGYLTDEHLKCLNLRGSNVEHVNLDYNNAITDQGKNIIRELIKDTHVIDVSMATYHYGAMFEPGIDKPFMLHNEQVLPVNDYLSEITPKSASSALALSDIISQSTFQHDILTTHVEPLPMAITHNPLGLFEHEIVLLA